MNEIDSMAFERKELELAAENAGITGAFEMAGGVLLTLTFNPLGIAAGSILVLRALQNWRKAASPEEWAMQEAKLQKQPLRRLLGKTILQRPTNLNITMPGRRIVAQVA